MGCGVLGLACRRDTAGSNGCSVGKGGFDGYQSAQGSLTIVSMAHHQDGTKTVVPLATQIHDAQRASLDKKQNKTSLKVHWKELPPGHCFHFPVLHEISAKPSTTALGANTSP